ncbi:MAG: LCP family protein [Clostridiales bacterium]|nr:LCP family protein [Clostridiales bacterium]
MKRKQHDTFARAFMKLVCLLLALILVFLLGATALFQQVLGKIHYTQPPADFGTRLNSFLSNLASEGIGQQSDLIGGTGSGIVNILLIGQDRREGEETARSDSMILCTYHRKTGNVTMTSFLRDLYVPIPGHHSNRINAAYSEGGTALLDDTLRENFGLHIDGNIEVDFSQFAQIIDLLGGVELELREDEAAEINKETGSDLAAGTQVLNGAQALTYARIRKLDADGDFSRTSRQRKVMSALLSRYRDMQWKDLLPLMDQLLPLISTDMNYGKLVLLAMEILPKLSSAQVTNQRIPADGTFSDEKINGMAVLSADLEANRQILRDTLLSK